MLYNVKANVFATKLGSTFGRIVHTTVVANNKEEATEEANINFNTYCLNLKKNHNNDFSFNNVTVE